jgi:hypothetical protein
MRWLCLMLSLAACRGGAKTPPSPVPPHPRCGLPAMAEPGDKQLYWCMCVDKRQHDPTFEHIICTSSACSPTDACQAVADWYHGSRTCSLSRGPEILGRDAGNRCWEMDERPASSGDAHRPNRDVAPSSPRPPPAFQQMLSAAARIRNAHTVEVVRLGVPTESVSRTGFVEWEKWPVGGDKADGLRSFFSSVGNFTQDDPGLRSQVDFSINLAVRFDDVDVLLDECSMWVTFAKLPEKPRTLSIRKHVQLHLARILVDITEAQKKGCLSLQIADSLSPARRQ